MMLGTVQWPSGTDEELWPLGDGSATRPSLQGRLMHPVKATLNWAWQFPLQKVTSSGEA